MGSIVAELAEKLTSATNSFDIDEQTLYVNTSADTVGIGTNSPDGKLSVHQSGTDDIFNLYDGTTNILTVADGGALTHKGAVTVGVDDTGHDVKFFGPTSGAYMEWEGDNNDRLVLMGATTKLGINEATPALPLHISHSSTNTSVDDNSSSHSAIMLQNTSNTDGNYTGIWNRDADNDATNAAIIFKNVSQSNSTSSMHFLTRASGAGAAVRMMIDTDGKVGIGTSSPDELLHVESGTNAYLQAETTSGTGAAGMIAKGTGSSFYVYNQGSTDNLRIYEDSGCEVNITPAGKVGIGNNAPDHELVIGAATPGADLVNTIEMRGSAGDSSLQRFHIVNQGDAGKIHFKLGRSGNAPSTFMTVGNSGEVGIGESSPSYLMHVAGTLGIKATIPSLYFDRGGAYTWSIRQGNGTSSLPLSTLNVVNNGGTPNMTFLDNGNVGIGTTTPNIAGFTSGTSAATVLTVKGAGSGDNPAVLELVCQDASGTGRHGEIRFSNMDGTSTATAYSSIRAFRAANSDNSSSLSFWTSDSGTMSQALTINHNNSVTIAGALSKGSGSFKIDHPLESKSDTHHLVHSFVEGPQADNIYRGKVTLVAGKATVNIDTVSNMTEGTFVALNTNTQCFTTNETGWDLVKGSVSGNILTITAKENTSTDTISWLVVGERHDQHMIDADWTDSDGKIIVEPEKSAG